MDLTKAEIGVATSQEETASHAFIQSTVYTWKAQLPRILLFNPRAPHVVTSPLIHVGNPGGPTSWRVQASHDCWDSDRRVRTIGLYLWRLSKNDLFSQKELTQLQSQVKFGCVFNIRMKYKFEILDTEGNTQFTRESEIKYIPEGAAIGGRNFALYDEVVRKNCIASDNTVTVRTTILLYRVVRDTPVERITVMFGDTKLGEYKASRLMKNSSLGKWTRDTKGKFLHAIDLQTILTATPLGEQHTPAALMQTASNMLMFLDEGKCPVLSKRPKKKDTLRTKAMLFKFARLFCIVDLEKACFKSMIEKHLNVPESLRIVRFMCKMKILDAAEYTPQINELKAFMRANFEELFQTQDMHLSFADYSEVYTKLVLEPDL